MFDYVHSLDNLKLAEKIATEQIKKDKKIKVFIGSILKMKLRKAGEQKFFENFYKECIENFKLDIIRPCVFLPLLKIQKNIFRIKTISIKFIFRKTKYGNV